MSNPVFFIEQSARKGELVLLPEDTSRHIAGSLRMKEGESLSLTDGHGGLYEAKISAIHKKKCEVTIEDMQFHERPAGRTTVAISLLKNSSRFDWFLEKATELGVSSIVPLLCARTERQHFRMDRMKSLLISAMIQSLQTWLPDLHEPVTFSNFWDLSESSSDKKLIAHCEPGNKTLLSEIVLKADESGIILIGPEGDFNSEEIHEALQRDYIPVNLGSTRLRTETAGVAAATLLTIGRKS
jgi:16S rRNA (uracil1498-N3)-methyltransferase